jgi:hypothetical protein
MVAAMVPAFPMFVMEAAVLLEQEKLEPFQTLQQRGHVREFDPETDLIVIFGSHQWTADTEPDHTGMQLDTLQGAIRRMVNGTLGIIGDDFGAQAFGDAGGAKTKKLTGRALERGLHSAGIAARGSEHANSSPQRRADSHLLRV